AGLEGLDDLANLTSDVDLSETVALYPSTARWRPDLEQWCVHVRGAVWAPGPNNLRRKLWLRLMRQLLKARPEELQNELFQRRVGQFLSTTSQGKQLVVQAGSRRWVLPNRSRRNGHFAA